MWFVRGLSLRIFFKIYKNIDLLRLGKRQAGKYTHQNIVEYSMRIFFCILQLAARVLLSKIYSYNNEYSKCRHMLICEEQKPLLFQLLGLRDLAHATANCTQQQNRRRCRWNDLKRTLLKVYPSCTIINVVQSAYIE